jgi:hypothetical protein
MKGDPEDWENRAIRVAATLDRAADELTKLIEDIRQARHEKGPDSDDGTKP